MRPTDISLAQHIGRGFKYQWLRLNRRHVLDTGAKAILAAKGIKIYDPKEIISPPFHRNIEILPPLEEEVIKEKTPNYVFHNIFSPPGGIAQVQHLINCVVRSTLPGPILDQIRDSSSEEDAEVLEAILHSQLQDSHQEKLPRVLDVINRPGWNFAREYGLPVRRKNKSLTYQLLLLLEKLHPEAAHRHMATNTKIEVSLKHSDQPFHMNHKAHFVLSSSTPLPSLSEVVGTEEELMPEIYPLSPFLHCKKSIYYSDEGHRDAPTNNFYPHTVFFHNNMPRMPHTDDTFSGVTLLKTFAHAAAYAKQWCKIENDNLETPLVIQVVHTNGKKYHIGVLQLNTLNLTDARKNIFWQHSLENLFERCSFEKAKPNLEGYNPKVFNLLRALHVQ